MLLKIRTMATNFSPCKGSYVLNQFPSNVMFGMNGFHVSASGAIQDHHGPLVLYTEQMAYITRINTYHTISYHIIGTVRALTERALFILHCYC